MKIFPRNFRWLAVLFFVIFLTMLLVTTWASLQLNLWTHLPTLIKDPWAVATLFDAYFGFIVFYVWVFYKESSVFTRLIWLVLILNLGNMAMASYALMQIYKLPQGAKIEELLLKK